MLSDPADAEKKAAEFAQDLVKAERKIEEQVLRAPIDGTVQQLALHTIGGVVTPAQALMIVVPADARIETYSSLPWPRNWSTTKLPFEADSLSSSLTVANLPCLNEPIRGTENDSSSMKLNRAR